MTRRKSNNQPKRNLSLAFLLIFFPLLFLLAFQVGYISKSRLFNTSPRADIKQPDDSEFQVENKPLNNTVFTAKISFDSEDTDFNLSNGVNKAFRIDSITLIVEDYNNNILLSKDINYDFKSRWGNNSSLKGGNFDNVLFMPTYFINIWQPIEGLDAYIKNKDNYKFYLLVQGLAAGNEDGLFNTNPNVAKKPCSTWQDQYDIKYNQPVIKADLSGQEQSYNSTEINFKNLIFRWNGRPECQQFPNQAFYYPPNYNPNDYRVNQPLPTSTPQPL